MDLQQIRIALDNETLKRGKPRGDHYLHMSAIGDCPRGLYNQLVAYAEFTPDASPDLRPTDNQNLFALDKEIKEAMRSRLIAAGQLKTFDTTEICAVFDGKMDDRVRGHIEGEFRDGALLHVKPTRDTTLHNISGNPHFNIPRRHFEQMQMYLRHGEYEKVRIVYVARENGDYWISEIRADERTQERLDTKAQNILIAVSRREPPICTCRQHSTEIPRPARRTTEQGSRTDFRNTR